jgi:cysteinyl-tRNA synthetase
LARFWVHNGFVLIDSEKMSKSLQNFRTIRDILDQYPAEALRLFLLTRQYRSPVDFNGAAMEEAEKNIKRLYETLALVEAELGKAPAPGGILPPETAEEFAALVAGWDAAMNDDMNTAAALGHMNSLGHLLNRVLEDKALRGNAGVRSLLLSARENFTAWSRILGLLLLPPTTFLADLKLCRAKRKGIDAATVDRLMEERNLARKNKDFRASDALRDKLAALGVAVRDTPAGAVWDIP